MHEYFRVINRLTWPWHEHNYITPKPSYFVSCSRCVSGLSKIVRSRKKIGLFVYICIQVNLFVSFGWNTCWFLILFCLFIPYLKFYLLVVHFSFPELLLQNLFFLKPLSFLLQQILQAHTDEVWFLQFSHNGKYLASSSNDRSAIIWEVLLFTWNMDKTYNIDFVKDNPLYL